MRLNTVKEDCCAEVLYVNVLSTVKNKSNHILNTTAKVEKVDLTFGLDCGATISVLSAETVNKNAIHILPSDTKVKTATGEISNVIGKTKPLRVEINGFVSYISFIILDYDDFDGLLGLDWFEATGAEISPGKRLLRFPTGPGPAKTQAPNFKEEKEVVQAIKEAEADDIDLTEDFHFAETSAQEEENYMPEPGARLDEQETKRFIHTMSIMKSVFAFNLKDLKRCTLAPFRIITENIEPIYLPAYKKSMAEREKMDKEIKEMLDLGIIRPSLSPWSAPALLVPKKNNKLRFTIDYRKINAATLTETWPIPDMDLILRDVSGKKWFSTMDMTSGFWQIQMHEDSIAKTGFSTPSGHYEWLVLPFGLKSAPAKFCKIMHSLLGNKKEFLVFLDDIVCFTDNLEEHIKALIWLANLFKKVNLRLNPKKCTFFAHKVELLGHVVSGEVVEMNPDKIESVKNIKVPVNVKEIQKYLGFATYYKKFIKNFFRYGKSAI